MQVTTIRSQPVTYRQIGDLESFSMANAVSEDTGLPMVIYISQKNALHGPHIKVSKTYGDKSLSGDWFSMTIGTSPKIIDKVDTGKITARDINLLIDFIQLNQDLLLQYWEQALPLSTKKMLISLRPLET